VNLFDDDFGHTGRTGGDWENHRKHRDPRSGPALDEIGVLALSSFQLARTDEVVVAVRGITAYSDGLLLAVVVLFSDEQAAEDLSWAMRDFSRSPGRFRFGSVFADGRSATSGTRDAPAVRTTEGPALLLTASSSSALVWDGHYWLTPLPPTGPLVLGCRWPDRGIPETLVEIDPAPLLTAAASSGPVWTAP
jgi:hypothetical protein